MSICMCIISFHLSHQNIYLYMVIFSMSIYIYWHRMRNWVNQQAKSSVFFRKIRVMSAWPVVHHRHSLLNSDHFSNIRIADICAAEWRHPVTSAVIGVIHTTAHHWASEMGRLLYYHMTSSAFVSSVQGVEFPSICQLNALKRQKFAITLK